MKTAMASSTRSRRSPTGLASSRFTDIDRVESFLDWNGPDEVHDPIRINAARIVASEPDRWNIIHNPDGDTTIAEVPRT